MGPASKRRKTGHARSEGKDDTVVGALEDVEAAASINGEGAITGGVGEESESEVVSAGSQNDTSDEDGPDEDAEGAQSTTSRDKANAKMPSTSSVSKAKPTAKPLETRNRLASGLSSTPGTFKSNLFKLQVDELLEQIRPRQGKREIAAEATLHQLKKVIDQLPSRTPLSVEDAEREMRKNDVVIPFPNPRPPKDAKYRLEYQKHAGVNVTGSHASKTSSRSSETLKIDMTVTMPSGMFQEKDFLNYRYFYKRAYYLACLAMGLREASIPGLKYHFGLFCGNPLQSVLVVEPETPDPKIRWQINILPCSPADLFPGSKLRLEKTCIRFSVEEKEATPFYNSTLRADTLTRPFGQLLHSASRKCDAFKDACLLGSTWLRQRGLGSDVSAGGFGNFEWSALMALMLEGGGPNGTSILSPGYSSYQLLKATLQVLAIKDFSKQPLALGLSDHTPAALGNGMPVAWDSAREHNLLYRMTPWGYKQLRREAQTTLTMLGDQNFDGFGAAFILRSDGPRYRYDCTLEVLNAEGSKAAHDIDTQEFEHRLYNVLRTALGDRAKQIDIAPRQPDSWSVNRVRPSQTGPVFVGLMVNPDTVGRTVDHGPPAEAKAEATSFRTFWGEKAELRRFKDGSILESLVWSASESGQTVLEQIVHYAVQKHIGKASARSLAIAVDTFSKLLPQKPATPAFQALAEAYKQMEMDIRSLDGMPLSVRQIMPADQQLRSTSSTVPMSGSRPVPANVVIQFEGSGRWPDDLVAIQRTKIAFLLRMSELLQESVRSATARIGLENSEHATNNQAYLDIIYDSGAAFRMRIYHDREQTLHERQLKDKAVDPKSKEIAALGLAKYKRDYVKSPAHTQAMSRLCSRHTALSGTIRLMKKWFSSHLLANHIPDEVIELLVARTFVRPWPWSTPSSVQTGFLRTLFFLSRWDWRAEPLIVDLSGDMKPDDFLAITTKFEAWRKIDPALNRVVLFAASSVDVDGTTWTDGRPAKVIAGRMTALAKAAVAEVDAKQLDLQPASLFTSSLRDFDFVLHLNPELLGKKKRKQNQTGFKNLEMDIMDDSSLIGYNPMVEFLQELESLFGAAIVLFSGGSEKPIIAGLWHLQTKTRPWKLNIAYSTVPKTVPGTDEVQADVNKEGILADMARLGGDMVERVEVIEK